MIYFILGFIFAQIGIALLDGLETAIELGIELLKGKAGIQIAKYNHEISKLSKEDEEGKVNAIGFAYSDDIEETIEEEDDDE